MQPNKFYHDPLDQWVEDHPHLAILAGLIGFHGLADAVL
jgi:hypothetical protein